MPHQGEFPGFAALGIAAGGLGFEVGEGDPGEGVGGLVEGDFVGFEIEEFGGAEFKGVAGKGGGEFAGGGSPTGAVVAENGEAGGEDAVAVKYSVAINQHAEGETGFFAGLDFEVDEQPFAGAIEFPDPDELIDVAVALVGFWGNLFKFFVEELGAFAPVDRLCKFREIKLDCLGEVITEDFLPRCVVVLARHTRSAGSVTMVRSYLLLWGLRFCLKLDLMMISLKWSIEPLLTGLGEAFLSLNLTIPFLQSHQLFSESLLHPEEISGINFP